MIQALIYEKFGVFYAVHYISKLLKNMGFSWQKAKFVPARQDVAERKKRLEKTWPEIMELVEEKDAYILFGDEASFPQWGSLTYTWAGRGKQPVAKTSGSRKSYKVFGLIEYFSGRFFCKGHEGRLNSESYASFLKEATVDKLLLEKIPIAGISRVTGISEPWLQKYINEKYKNIPKKISIVKEKGRLTIQCDEMWSFVGSKNNKKWIWLAIDQGSREIVGVYVGSRDRKGAQGLWDSLPAVYRQ